MTTIADSDPANVIFGNHGVSSEYLSLFFCPANISCVQLEFMMTYSIFSTKEDIHAAVVVAWIYQGQFRQNNIV